MQGEARPLLRQRQAWDVTTLHAQLRLSDHTTLCGYFFKACRVGPLSLSSLMYGPFFIHSFTSSTPKKKGEPWVAERGVRLENI